MGTFSDNDVTVTQIEPKNNSNNKYSLINNASNYDNSIVEIKHIKRYRSSKRLLNNISNISNNSINNTLNNNDSQLVNKLNESIHLDRSINKN